MSKLVHERGSQIICLVAVLERVSGQLYSLVSKVSFVEAVGVKFSDSLEIKNGSRFDLQIFAFWKSASCKPR